MKIGILGLGSIGQRHANNAVVLGHQVFYHDPARTGHQHNIWQTPRDVVLDGVDAIVVASPSKEHAKDFMDAIDAGKHVLVEKPFGYDCPQFLDGYLQGVRSKNTDLIIAAGFNVRFHPCVEYAKFMVSEGVLGDIKSASFSVLQKSEKPEYLRDGIIRNWLSHEIDLAHHFFGGLDVEFCTADDQREANIILKAANAADVFINGDYFTEPQQRYFWIDGEYGSLYVNLEKAEIYSRSPGGNPKLVHGYTTWTWDDTYVQEMKSFLNSIHDKYHLKPLATGEDGVRSLYTVMAAREKAGI